MTQTPEANVSFDFRYALRRLIRARGFTLAASLTIALGVGANSAIFSVINAVLLRPPVGVAEPQRLVGLFTSDYSGPPYGSSSFADLDDFGAQGADVFTGVTGFSPRPAAVGSDDNLERIAAEVVTDNYFQVLGTQMMLGRAFGPEQRVKGGEPVAVISHGLWQRRFASDPAIIGKPVRMNAREFTIIGVTPVGFSGSVRPLVSDVWVPAALGAYLGMSDDFASRGDRSALVYARLKPGVTIEQARSRMADGVRALPARCRVPGSLDRRDATGPTHRGPRRAGDAHPAAGSWSRVRLRGHPDGHGHPRAARLLCERRRPPAGARRQPTQGGRHPDLDRSEPRADHPPDAHREPSACGVRRRRGHGGVRLGGARADGGRHAIADPGAGLAEPDAGLSRALVHARDHAPHRSRLRPRARVAREPSGCCHCAQDRHAGAATGRPSLLAPRRARHRTSGIVDTAAGRRAAVPPNAARRGNDRSGIPHRSHAAARHLPATG